MDQSPNDSNARVGQIIEHELTLLREAIAMVAAGSSPRVTVGGLRFGEALLLPARGLAAAAGVRLVPLWTPDDAGADITVESIGDD